MQSPYPGSSGPTTVKLSDRFQIHGAIKAKPKPTVTTTTVGTTTTEKTTPVQTTEKSESIPETTTTAVQMPSQLSETNLTVEELQKQVKIDEKRIELYQTQLRTCKDQLTHHKSQVDAFQKETTSYQQQIKVLQGTQKKVVDEKTLVQARVSQLEKTNQHLQQQNGQLQHQIQEQKIQLNAMKKQNEMQTEESRKLQTEKMDLTKKLARLSTEIGEIVTKLETMEEENKMLQAQMYAIQMVRESAESIAASAQEKFNGGVAPSGMVFAVPISPDKVLNSDGNLPFLSLSDLSREFGLNDDSNYTGSKENHASPFGSAEDILDRLSHSVAVPVVPKFPSSFSEYNLQNDRNTDGYNTNPEIVGFIANAGNGGAFVSVNDGKRDSLGDEDKQSPKMWSFPFMPATFNGADAPVFGPDAGDRYEVLYFSR